MHPIIMHKNFVKSYTREDTSCIQETAAAQIYNLHKKTS